MKVHKSFGWMGSLIEKFMSDPSNYDMLYKRRFKRPKIMKPMSMKGIPKVFKALKNETN